nr:hypothetical protein [Candidatus Sigynarchaeum springense]
MLAFQRAPRGASGDSTFFEKAQDDSVQPMLIESNTGTTLETLLCKKNLLTGEITCHDCENDLELNDNKFLAIG